MFNLGDASDAHWMHRCEEEARRAERAGNTAVGAVLVLDGLVVAEAAEETPAGPRPFPRRKL